MENSAGYDFIHCEKVGQEAVPRAIELFEKPQPEVLVELIRRLCIHDVHGIDPLPIRCAIETNSVVVEVLLQVLVGLKGQSKASGLRLSLIGIHGVVKVVAGFVEVSASI